MHQLCPGGSRFKRYFARQADILLVGRTLDMVDPVSSHAFSGGAVGLLQGRPRPGGQTQKAHLVDLSQLLAVGRVGGLGRLFQQRALAVQHMQLLQGPVPDDPRAQLQAHAHISRCRQHGDAVSYQCIGAELQ